jgi:uncharacterized membrane protein YecN with MAPEG domain
MMMQHRWTALVTLLALLVYLWMGAQVGRARGKCGIDAPAMTGDPLLERAVRVQTNTLEWLPIFLVSLCFSRSTGTNSSLPRWELSGSSGGCSIQPAT